jgi:hypothetical protein
LLAISDRSAVVWRPDSRLAHAALEERGGSLTRVLVELIERRREAQPSLS